MSVVASALSSQMAIGWVVSAGGLRCESDRVNAVVVDEHGDVITVGLISPAAESSAPDFAVVKFDGRSGAERWRKLIDGPGHYGDRALAVTIDDEGDIIAAGQAYTVEYDILVVKLAHTDGSLIWQTMLSNAPPGHRYNEPSVVATDSSGDIFVGGGVDAQENGSHPRMFVAKLRGLDGAEQWRIVGERPFLPDGARTTAIVADESGGLYLGGHEDGPEAAVSKVTSDQGFVQWTHGLGQYRLSGMQRLAGGDLVAGSESALARLRASDGSEVWRVQNSVARTLAVDHNDDVLIAGDGRVKKVAGSDGREIWSDAAPPGMYDDLIALDRAGDVILGRRIETSEIIKRAGSNGALLWSSVDQRYPIVVQPVALASDDTGNAIVVGYDLRGAGYSVAKLSAVDGAALSGPPCRGDCNGDGEVEVSELIRGVNISLRNAATCACWGLDANDDGKVKVDELVRAVLVSLAGCPA